MCVAVSVAGREGVCVFVAVSAAGREGCVCGCECSCERGCESSWERGGVCVAVSAAGREGVCVAIAVREKWEGSVPAVVNGKVLHLSRIGQVGDNGVQ